MFYPSLVQVLVAGLVCSIARGQNILYGEMNVVDIAARDIFSTIGVCSTTGSACSSSSSHIKTSSGQVTSTTTSKSTSKPATPTSTSTPPGSGSNSLAVTTTFTQPPECTADSVSQMVWDTQLWKNFIDPIPASTYTSCFPSQFVSSVLAVASGKAVPAFSALICPSNWETYNINTTYIICCPSGFGFIAPNITDTIRPGLGAICTSSVIPGALLDITSFDSSTLVTISPITVGVNGTLILADAYDGIAASTTTGPSSTASSSHSITSTTSTKSTTVSLPSSSAKISTPTQTTSSTTSSPSGTYSYVGCYTESTSGHALSSASYTNQTTMTLQVCEAFCAGYTYLGLEYHGECYCGNSFGAGSVPTAETGCVDTCRGNKTQICGGASKLSVWKKV